MFDLVNDLKVIQGLRAGATGNTASTGDWVNCENFHHLYAVCDVARPTASTAVFEWYSGSAYAGTGSSNVSTGCRWWVNDGVAFDRLTLQTTMGSSFSIASATGLVHVVSRLDCAILPTSHPYAAFAVEDMGTVNDFVNITYIGVPRYKGAEQFLATTSST